jgi:hypothetical protein
MENDHLQVIELAVGAGARYFRRAKGDHRLLPELIQSFPSWGNL